MLTAKTLWLDAQADLSLRWAHSHIVGFVMSRLNFVIFVEMASFCNISFTYVNITLSSAMYHGRVH